MNNGHSEHQVKLQSIDSANRQTVSNDKEHCFDENGHEREGVIKYHLLFSRQPIASCVSIEPLDMWRHVLFNLELIGQNSARYGGLGFGNISTRLSLVTSSESDGQNSQHENNSFLISGSQTGHLPYLQPEDCAVVSHCDAKNNQLVAQGECKPSSESLTHGVLYNAIPSVGAVVHVHSPLIWPQADALSLLYTDAHIPYGTPAMADAVTNVARDIISQSKEPVFVMKGHVDGVVSFGANLADAVSSLLAVYHRAILKTVR